MARISSAGVQRVDAVVDAEPGAHLGRDRDRLQRARVHAAAGGDERGVVVGPRRARAGRTAAGVRRTTRPGRDSGSRNTCRWSNAATSWMCSRQQHAVAEHVARHVADADDGEVVAVGIDAEVAEVAAHRLPRAAGGDAHLLVVVAVRAARRERVAEPEAAAERDLVGDVGERRGALVGRDDEVRIVAVVAHDLMRAARPCRRRGCR